MSFQFEEPTKGFFVREDCRKTLEKMSLLSLEDVFDFNGGENLHKNNLSTHRSRVKFKADDGGGFMFMKRYKQTPVLRQIRNWISHKNRALTADYDRLSSEELSAAGINTPKTIAYGGRWKGVFEDCSFYICREIEDADSLERKLPDCFTNEKKGELVNEKKQFICALAEFVKKFHDTGFRHRDLYLAHIFYGSNGKFHLIDLHRCFRPGFLSKRFLVKDIAQLFYSAPGKYVSNCDRMRFIRSYFRTNKLAEEHKKLIRQVLRKSWRMARHDMKHGRNVPFIK